MATSPEARLLAPLKLHNPHRVLAYFGTGEDDCRKVAVPPPSVRKRWSRVVAAINARSWTKCELLDKEGAVLAYIENVEPAGEPEDMPLAKGHAEHALAVKILDTVMKAISEDRAHRNAEQAQANQAMTAIVRENATALRSLAALYREQVEVASEAAATGAQIEAATEAAANANGFNIKELIEAGPTILQFVAMAKQWLASGGPPNGHNQ